MGCLIPIGFIFGIWIIVWLINSLSNLRKRAKKYDELKPRLDDLDNYSRKLEAKKAEFTREIETRHSELDNRAMVIDTLIKEKTKGFPWLVKVCDDYFSLQDGKLANRLITKPHPALRASETVRQISKERREAEKAARSANYLLDFCRYLAPWLDEYIGLEAEELDEIIKQIHSSWEKKEKEFDEEVKRHFGPKYEGLTPTEKLQKKLDWYWGKPNKSNWQIGRDYERYVGYLYETKGWKVYYHGKKGFEDLGRDLICKKGNSVEIIQCKRWAQEKTIHEKHIYYLFGTTVEYFIENFGGEDLQLALLSSLVRERNVSPKLVATIDVSQKAEQVARVLGVEIEKIPSANYPSVKCNVSRRTGEKIFHLPFDQQYDTALIEEERMECYVETIKEAEAIGFRHAYRWKGEVKEA